jgi:hypothetical protein
MGYGTEFINVLEPRAGGAWRAFAPGGDVDTRENNALNFRLMYAELTSAPSRGGYIYFPPGRWEIGRPRPTLLASGVEQISDLVVPAGVTLMFAPGAVLVPASYTEAEVMAHPDKPWLRRPAVNAYAGASITDLGAFNGRVDSAELIHADSPTLLVTVPRMSDL